MEENMGNPDAVAALIFIKQYGGIDGGHHKQWVLDQVVRILTGCPEIEGTAYDTNGVEYSYTMLGESERYRKWLIDFRDGEDGPDTYEWDEGIAP